MKNDEVFTMLMQMIEIFGAEPFNKWIRLKLYRLKERLRLHDRILKEVCHG